MLKLTSKYCLDQDNPSNLLEIFGNFQYSEGFIHQQQQQKHFLQLIKRPYFNLEEHQKGQRSPEIRQLLNQSTQSPSPLPLRVNEILNLDEPIEPNNFITYAEIKRLMEISLIERKLALIGGTQTITKQNGPKIVIPPNYQIKPSPYQDGWQENVIQKYYRKSVNKQNQTIRNNSLRSQINNSGRQRTQTKSNGRDTKLTNYTPDLFESVNTSVPKDYQYDFSDIDREFDQILKNNTSQKKRVNARGFYINKYKKQTCIKNGSTLYPESYRTANYQKTQEQSALRRKSFELIQELRKINTPNNHMKDLYISGMRSEYADITKIC